MASNSNSTFDFLLADQQQSRPSNSQTVVKAEADSNPLDWLLADSNVHAPHPDAFELELESIAALGALDADFATLPSFNTADTFNPGNFNLYTQYRGAPVATSVYSGYGGAPSTVTVSSESLSAYGSIYEPYEQKIIESTAASNAAQHSRQQLSQLGNQQASLASLFPDIDLNFSTFNLAGSAAVSAVSADSMLPRLSLDTQETSNGDTSALSRGSSSASPSGAADIHSYLVNAGATAPNYMSATQSQANPSVNNAPNVPRNGNSSLVTPIAARDNVQDGDPRKKYQCPTCPRAFARAFNLKTHMATHDPNRVKAFVCRHSGCGRSFSRKHDLGRHLVSIHQDSTIPAQESSTSPSATVSVGTASGSKAKSNIGVGSSEADRVWCDSCGRGWLVGSRDACSCNEKNEKRH